MDNIKIADEYISSIFDEENKIRFIDICISIYRGELLRQNIILFEGVCQGRSSLFRIISLVFKGCLNIGGRDLESYLRHRTMCDKIRSSEFITITDCNKSILSQCIIIQSVRETFNINHSHSMKGDNTLQKYDNGQTMCAERHMNSGLGEKVPILVSYDDDYNLYHDKRKNIQVLTLKLSTHREDDLNMDIIALGLLEKLKIISNYKPKFLVGNVYSHSSNAEIECAFSKFGQIKTYQMIDDSPPEKQALVTHAFEFIKENIEGFQQFIVQKGIRLDFNVPIEDFFEADKFKDWISYKNTSDLEIKYVSPIDAEKAKIALRNGEVTINGLVLKLYKVSENFVF